MASAESVTNRGRMAIRLGVAGGVALAALTAPHSGCEGWKEFPYPGAQAEGPHTDKTITDGGITVIDFKQTRLTIKTPPKGFIPNRP